MMKHGEIRQAAIELCHLGYKFEKVNLTNQ